MRTHSLKSGESVYEVRTMAGGQRTGVAYLNLATHGQKIGNASDAAIGVRAEGVRAAHEGRATRDEVLFLHLEDLVRA